MRAKRQRLLIQGGLLLVLVVLVGCVSAEVKSATSALEAARSAGKDKECAAEFQASENLVRQAESLCQTCKFEQSNALAKEVEAKISRLCPAVPKAAPAPAPAPAPEAVRVPAPTASLSAA